MLCHSRRARFDSQGCGQGQAKAEDDQENYLLLLYVFDHMLLSIYQLYIDMWTTKAEKNQ